MRLIFTTHAKIRIQQRKISEEDIRTIYLLLQKLMGSPKRPVHGPAKPGEQRRSSLNCDLAREVLGWQPRVSLEEGLSRTVAAFRENR